MQILSRRTLALFWAKHKEAEAPLKVWYARVAKADWKSHADVKEEFGTSVDFIGDNRIIFDIGGNKFRLIVHAAYSYRKVLIKFAGTTRITTRSTRRRSDGYSPDPNGTGS